MSELSSKNAADPQSKEAKPSRADATKKKEMEQFTNQLAKKIANMNNSKKNSKRKLFGLSVNPFIVIVTIIVGFFVLMGLFNQNYFEQKLPLSEVMQGLENDQYSQLIIKDNGEVAVREKSFLVSAGEINNASSLDEDLNIISQDEDRLLESSLDDLTDLFKEDSIITRVRSIFSTPEERISQILYGDTFAIFITNEEYASRIVRDVTKQDVRTYLQDENISLDDVSVEQIDLRYFVDEISEDSLESRIGNAQVETLIEVDGISIAEVRSEFVDEFTVDWSPNIYTFADILQQEGIDIGAEDLDFEVVTEKVPAGITFDTILTLLTIGVFIFLGVVIFRSAQASGMGIMQFGQSKAKMFFGRKTGVSFNDVAGIDEAREELNEIVDFLRNPNKYRKLGARIPKGILMFGPPGTGKTLLARAIAGEAGVPFFHTSGSEFEEMLVGAGASRVRDLFAKAMKAAPALIFIDEIDAVARKRGTRIQSGSTEQTLNQILVEMDGFTTGTNVIVIAATNRPDVLDPAILRPGRFDRQVRIEAPDKDGRTEILKIHGKNKPFAKDVDLERIAKRTVGFTGADLENILNEAAIIAAKDENKEISMSHIDEAVSKVLLGPAKKSRKRTDEELKLVAYHEAGHALVAKYTEGSTPVDKISIVSRGGTGGVTMFLPEKDENIVSKRKLLADIRVSLGGRAAEEVALSDVSTGASSDIEKATKVARQMIQKFGMSDTGLGMVQYGQSLDNQYLGYHYGDSKDYSEDTASRIDDEIRSVINTAYDDAINVVTKYRKILDKLADTLIEKEVLDKEEFLALIEAEEEKEGGSK